MNELSTSVLQNIDEQLELLEGGGGVSEVQRSKDDGSSATETKVLGGLVHVVYRHLVSICSHLQ